MAPADRSTPQKQRHPADGATEQPVRREGRSARSPYVRRGSARTIDRATWRPHRSSDRRVDRGRAAPRCRVRTRHAVPTIPATAYVHRNHSACGTGRTSLTALTTSPITMALLTVPMPGRWRSGIHSSSTNDADHDDNDAETQPGQFRHALVEHVPGSSPRFAAIIRLMPVPYRARPRNKAVSRRSGRSRSGRLPIRAMDATLKANRA